MTYTVVIRNELLKTTRARGTFEQVEQAEKYARNEARLSRTFAVCEVWIGTPRNPIRPLANLSFRGERQTFDIEEG